MKRSVLLVEDDEAFAYALTDRLRAEGFEVRSAVTLKDALARASEEPPLVAVVDYQLPDGTGVELVPRLPGPFGANGGERGAVAVMITAYGSIEGAVEAIRAGCIDYVPKGSDLDQVAFRVRKAAELAELRGRVTQYERAFATSVDDCGIDGQSATIAHVREQIRLAGASADTTVLVDGETGTGKQLVARAVHAASKRRNRPLVEVDCTTLASGLVESELFGHVRGAFTGADQRKPGLVDTAAGGTLVLDEVGELDVGMQAKLLRLLQERRIRPLGALADHEVDIRILATTNRDLDREVARGAFRQDLYYRLQVFRITLPPLRERAEDIPILAARFAEEISRRLGKPAAQLDPGALRYLRFHPLPGNVRQLRALVEQAVARAPGGKLTLELFQDSGTAVVPKPPRRGRPRRPVSAQEAQSIRRAMERFFGNQSKASESLGISRFQLRRKLKLIWGTS